jgi:putative Holliday junction resolvase
MRSGVRLGVDVGTARIGVARSDPHGMLATPLETVKRGPGDLARIAELAVEYAAVEIVVGLPIALSGRETASTGDARLFARELAAVQGAPVRMVDERLSTVSANSALRASGRTAKNSRSVVDQVAAVIILQHALDFERSAQTPPGIVVDPHSADPHSASPHEGS